MTTKTSAGLMMYRLDKNGLEVFLAHPGGPFFKNKENGYWGIPKGEVEPGEDLLAAAVREFAEETGYSPEAPFIPLGSAVMGSGKVVHAWAFAGVWEDGKLPDSNTFSIEWPPGSGNNQCFPEIDKAAFFRVRDAIKKINTAQAEFIYRLQSHLESPLTANDCN